MKKVSAAVLHCGAVCAALFLLLPWRLDAQSTTDSLPDLKARFETTMADTIRRYDVEVSGLFSKYVKALDALEAELQGKGDLEGVLAVRKEKGDAQASRSVPDKDEADGYQALLKLRAQYRQQNRQALIAEGKAIIELLDKYRGLLDNLEKRLTKDGLIDRAVEVRAENDRVKNGKEAQKAAFILAVEAPSSDKPSVSQDAPAQPPVSGPKARTASLMESTVIPAFRYSEDETRRQAVNLLNRYIGSTFSGGIKLRLNAPRLGVQSVVNDPSGMPRYNVPYVPVPYQHGVRTKVFNLTNVTAADLLKMICAGCGLGYRIDNTNGEVVVVEDTAPDAEWTLLAKPPEQLAVEMQAVDVRNKYAGRTVLVTGELEASARGVSEQIVVLSNKVRLRFPKTGAGAAESVRLGSMLNEAEKANRDNTYREQFVEVTVLGEVAKNTAVRQLTLEKVTVMECYSGFRPSGVRPVPTRGGIKTFDGPNRRLRKIRD